MYDDWSLAPEMSARVRAIARLGYRSVERLRGDVAVTVNTPFMRGKLAAARPVLVPNGVDPRMCDWGSTDRDDTRRVVMLGNFFEGRTDWELLERIARSPSAQEVRIFGANDRCIELAGRLNDRMAEQRVKCFPKTPMREIAARLGRRTVVAVPHLVSDYTMSQDLMKAYQAVALGCRVLLPVELIPRPIPKEFVVGAGLGVNVDDCLEALFLERPVSNEERREFAINNSWNARARQIAGLLHEL
jgi:hypothetical protein